MSQIRKQTVRGGGSVIDDLTKDIETTADLVQQSLIDFATIKTELKFLVETVKDLRTGDGGGPIITRIALLEQALAEVREYISNINN